MSRKLGPLAVAAGVVALALVWLAGPGGPPIYDGLPITDPPYRYLDPPPGTPHTPPPTSVTRVVDLAASPNGTAEQTGEAVPQAQAQVPTEMLRVPPGTAAVRVSLTPVPPPPVPPPDGALDGNVYRLAVTTLSGTPLRMKPGVGQLFEVVLRGTGSAREPRFEEFDGAAWSRVPFDHPESGIFESTPSQPGDFALVLPPGRPLLGPGLKAAVVIGSALVVLAVILAAVRSRRLAG